MRARLGRQKELSVRHLYRANKRLGCAIRPFFTPLLLFLSLFAKLLTGPQASAKKNAV